MVFKYRRNDGKRFTAPKQDESPSKVSVFTQLNDRERAKEAKQTEKLKASDKEFVDLIHYLKTGTTGTVDSSSMGYNDPALLSEEGWTIIRNKKANKGSDTPTVTRVVPDIHLPDTEASSTLPIHDAHHWPIDIRIDTEEGDAVNIKSLLGNTLNSFQNNDVNTWIAPIDYDINQDPAQYIQKSSMIPSCEQELKKYILRIKTQQDSILVSAIFATNSFVYQLMDKNMQYYEEANIYLRLNLLQADKPAVAGFFLELLAKQETLYDYQCCIQTLIGVNAPQFQVIFFDLTFRYKGQRFPAARTKVFAIQVQEEDLQEMVFLLKTACRFSPLYHFIAWEEYTCLKDEQKLKLIEVQNNHFKKYISFRVDGFNHEPPGMMMWMEERIEILTPETTTATPPRKSNGNVSDILPDTPKQDNTHSFAAKATKVHVSTVKDCWDDSDDDIVEDKQPSVSKPPTKVTINNTTTTNDQSSDVIMRETSVVDHIPPITDRSDKPEK